MAEGEAGVAKDKTGLAVDETGVAEDETEWLWGDSRKLADRRKDADEFRWRNRHRRA